LILTDYLRFLRLPTYQARSEPVHWKSLGILFLFDAVVGISLGYTLDGLSDYYPLDHLLEDEEPVKLLLLGVLLAPPLEEITFRLWLRVSRSALFALAFLIFFIGVLLLPTSQLGAVLLISVCVCLLVLTLMGYQPDIERTVARHFGLFFYTSSGLFAAVHLMNFVSLAEIPLLLTPLLVLPQFVGGTILGYIRMRYGLKYAILNHAAFNALFFSLSILFPM
jgi:hypothetical protein